MAIVFIFLVFDHGCLFFLLGDWVIRSLLFFLMNDLFRIHSFYMYSLNSFVVIFMRGIDLVSEDKSSGKGKGSLMSRFKKAARKIIQSQRFSWNVDILHTVTAITKGGQGMNMMDIQGTTTLLPFYNFYNFFLTSVTTIS